VVLSGTTVVAVDNYSSDLLGHLTVFKGTGNLKKVCEKKFKAAPIGSEPIPCRSYN
jgi:hypothetical protein